MVAQSLVVCLSIVLAASALPMDEDLVEEAVRTEYPVDMVHSSMNFTAPTRYALKNNSKLHQLQCRPLISLVCRPLVQKLGQHKVEMEEVLLMTQNIVESISIPLKSIHKIVGQARLLQNWRPDIREHQIYVYKSVIII